MSITDWPEEDRPREKLLAKGEQALTDAELIAIFLKTGVAGKTALDLAKELLREHGNLKQLMHLSTHQFLQKPGVGRVKLVNLKAALELGRRYLAIKRSPGDCLDNVAMTKQYLMERLQDYTQEVFACVFMDTHFRLMSYEVLFHGTINEANIYPREIVKRALALNAAKLILAHNHPSGNCTPSMADKEVTVVIQRALRLVDVELVDHIVIGEAETFSFAQMGLM